MEKSAHVTAAAGLIRRELCRTFMNHNYRI
jgi:hypothetical protein